MLCILETGFRVPGNEPLVGGLIRLRTETHALYAKTQFSRWSVKGSQAAKLKVLLEKQSSELSLAFDVIGVRLLALGIALEGIRRVFGAQEVEQGMCPETLVEELVCDHQAILRLVKRRHSLVASAKDDPSAELVRERLRAHDEAIASLRSMQPERPPAPI